MTSAQQAAIDAVNRQTLAIYIGCGLVFAAVLAVLVVWWIEYRRDRVETITHGRRTSGVGGKQPRSSTPRKTPMPTAGIPPTDFDDGGVET